MAIQTKIHWLWKCLTFSNDIYSINEINFIVCSINRCYWMKINFNIKIMKNIIIMKSTEKINIKLN